ncbi:MAG: CRISPR-associated protein Cas4 [Bacteroidota bacterium]
MYTEDEFIQLSALQHYVFCPRQCALIHVEGQWDENVYTVKGGILHEKVDTDTYETRGTLKTVRGLRVHSARLGIVGRCDVVEFRSLSKVAFSLDESVAKTTVNAVEIMPVEFKSGQTKHDISDKVQLCAQAFCLEEMMHTRVDRGAFFYGRVRRREVVEITQELRAQTESIIASVREIVSKRIVPSAQYMEKCKRCSLEDACQPKAMNERKLHAYIQGLYQP